MFNFQKIISFSEKVPKYFNSTRKHGVNLLFVKIMFQEKKDFQMTRETLQLNPMKATKDILCILS